MELLLLTLSLNLGPVGTAENTLAPDPELAVIHEIITRVGPMEHEAAGHLAQAVVEEAEANGLSPYLILAVIHTESTFRPAAISPVGAAGLMQIRPFVGEWLAGEVAAEWSETALFDPALNVKLGTHYIAHLADRFGGDVDLALIAYNWGPTRLDGELERHGGDVPEAMRVYPSKVWRAYARIRNLRAQLAQPQAVSQI